MRHFHWRSFGRKTGAGVGLLLLFLLVISCGDKEEKNISAAGGYSSISFRVATVENSGSLPSREASMDCEGLGIASIRAMVYSSEDQFLKAGGPWECELGEGVIEQAPAGHSARVVIICLDKNGDPLYRGESAPISLEKEIVADAGLITAIRFSPTLLSPSTESQLSKDRVLLSWQSVPDASRYAVLISTEADFSTVSQQTTVTDTRFEATGLSPSTLYYWQVAAIDVYGNRSAPSDTWRFTSSDAPPIDEPATGIDMTGSWNYTVENQWSSGQFCSQIPQVSQGSVSISQSGNTFTVYNMGAEQITLDGTIDGNNTYTCDYTADISDEEVNGSTTTTIIFSPESENSASGKSETVISYPGYFECKYGFSVKMTRQK